MRHNKCSTCHADGGRCGLMVTISAHPKPECMNCHDTRTKGAVVVHTNLPRTENELKRTFAILA